jgi:tetratricopeptide (TPR) repeat protein
VLRSAIFILLFASLTAYPQTSAPTPQSQPVAPAAPQTIAPEVAQAEAAIAQSDWKSAAAKLTPYIAAHLADPRALFDAGYVADAQNRLDDAVSLYRQAIEADPKSFEAHVSLGLLLARQGKFDDARPELALATKLDAGEVGPLAKARSWRALAQIDRAADPAEASSDLLEALKLSPETPDDTLLAAELAEKTGDTKAAQAAYRRVLAADPKSAAANAGLAHILIAANQFPEAETLLRAALQQAPDDPALTAQLASVLAAQDKAEALPLIQKLHDAHPENAAITRMLAEILAEAGDASGSDHYYTALLAASPKDPDLLVAHGQNLTRQLRFAEAFAAFDKATQLDPANADGWAGLAFAASKTNQPSITLHALTMRSKYLPEVPSTYFLWATSYDSLHQKEAAITYYRHFLEASAGKFPNQEWQARQRIQLLTK